MLRDQSFLESFVYSVDSIQTTRTDAHLSCLGSGKYGDWLDIRVCNDAVKNICSAGLLRVSPHCLKDIGIYCSPVVGCRGNTSVRSL